MSLGTHCCGKYHQQHRNEVKNDVKCRCINCQVESVWRSLQACYIWKRTTYIDTYIDSYVGRCSKKGNRTHLKIFIVLEVYSRCWPLERWIAVDITVLQRFAHIVGIVDEDSNEATDTVASTRWRLFSVGILFVAVPVSNLWALTLTFTLRSFGLWLCR